ncbi:hypothetical protein KAU11_12815 [Candidatus Babeliales bacterium]|nr:hypothetical protein [Candidatus Babeliales bacterium]
MKALTLTEIEEVMTLRLSTWESKAKGSKGTEQACLIASICDTREDIKTIRRARWIIERYITLLDSKGLAGL